jgi:excinuclease UvrABC helicase subunit UvrB
MNINDIWKTWDAVFTGHDLWKGFIAREAEDEEETFEVKKGDYISTIKCKFNKKGYLVSVSSESVLNEKAKKEQELRREMKKAADAEDFVKAAEFKKKLSEL